MPEVRPMPIRLIAFLILAAPASAHTGHLGEVAGHDHWTLGAGLAVVAGAAALAWIKGRRKEAGEEDQEATDEPERDEAPA